MIFIDFRIAFDTLECNIFNFGSDLINWVRIFYQNIQNCVINNGLASEYFTLEQSVKQGDPLLTSLSWPRKPWQFQFEKILKCKELKLAIMKLNLYDMQTIPVFSVFWRPKPSRDITVRAHKAQKRSVRRFRSRLLILSEGGFLVIIGSLV